MIPQLTLDVPIIPCIISSCLIGALYPLTQVYQHEADRKDGVTTISYLLGKKGSFLFSALLFGVATLLLYKRFEKKESMDAFYLYLMIMLPVVLFFLYWMIKVWKDERAANFKNSLMMNVLATACTSAFFITLFFMKH
jgi:1,4-dihydroxy-2-naphthoate octaprenyltransferase